MLKIQHPGSVAREREKRVTNWEVVRTVRYSNGVEYQLLIGSLPHGQVQSAISANRNFKLDIVGEDANLTFGDGAVAIMDFTNGDRPTADADNVLVLDACHFLPSLKVGIRNGADATELAPDGQNLKATFGDGTEVKVEPHGSHGHVQATRDGKPLKTFFNGKDNVLYVLGPAD